MPVDQTLPLGTSRLLAPLMATLLDPAHAQGGLTKMRICSVTPSTDCQPRTWPGYEKPSVATRRSHRMGMEGLRGLETRHRLPCAGSGTSRASAVAPAMPQPATRSEVSVLGRARAR